MLPQKVKYKRIKRKMRQLKQLPYCSKMEHVSFTMQNESITRRWNDKLYKPCYEAESGQFAQNLECVRFC